MKKIALCALYALLVGCSSNAAPNFINGHYYMAGDSACSRYQVLSETRIMCMNSSGNYSGYRDAMNDQQLQMYHYQQMNEQVQMQQFNQQLQQTGQSWQQSGQQILQQSQQYTPPAVTPIQPPGGNQVRCINAGIYTNCRY